jgi:hypothetical protein
MRQIFAKIVLTPLCPLRETPLDLEGKMGKLSRVWRKKGCSGPIIVICDSSKVQIPASLATLAARAGISFRQALTLLEVQQQIVAHRSSTKKENLDKVDWQKFYEAVKNSL